jgi:hypothetical protein
MVLIEELTECDKAADIYQCCREKAPAMTETIQSTYATKSEPTGVNLFNRVKREKADLIIISEYRK